MYFIIKQQTGKITILIKLVSLAKERHQTKKILKGNLLFYLLANALNIVAMHLCTPSKQRHQEAQKKNTLVKQLDYMILYTHTVLLFQTYMFSVFGLGDT